MNNIDTTLAEMANTLILKETISLDECRIREDLYGLYNDIWRELRRKAPDKENMIYSYAALLQKELDLCSPRMAYEAGAILGCNSQGDDGMPERAFMRYMCRVGLDPAARQLQSEVNGMYNEIYGMLDEAYSLIDDFTHLYRQCHGIIKNGIYDFFRMGYDIMIWASHSGREETGSAQDMSGDTDKTPPSGLQT